MLAHMPTTNADNWKLVIVAEDSGNVLVSNHRSPSLPMLAVPTGSRVAGFITNAALDEYGVRVLQVASLPSCDSTHVAVLQIIGTERTGHRSWELRPLDQTCSEDLSSEDRESVTKIIRGEDSRFGHYGNLRWFSKLLDALPRGLGVDGQLRLETIRQLNCGHNFMLFSAMVDGIGRIWFKGVGEPNRSEYPLTVSLSNLIPDYLPPIIATYPEWGAWITADVEGPSLLDLEDRRLWTGALRALASIQIKVLDAVPHLRRSGAKSASSRTFQSCFSRFFADAEQAMKAQTSTKSLPLSARELGTLRRRLLDALRRLEDGSVPETIIHGDLSGSNVLYSAGSYRFLDWAEGYIGFPFVAAEYLIAALEQRHAIAAAEIQGLRAAYVDAWKTVASDSDIAFAASVAPSLAPIFYAVWIWERQLLTSSLEASWPIIRSLLRKSYRELNMVPRIFV